MDVLTAAFNVVHDYPGGAPALATRLGKASSTLSHEVQAGYPGAKFGLLDALKVTKLSGDLGILNSFAAECGCLVLPVMAGVLPVMAGVGSGDGAMLALSKLATEFGDVVSEVSKSLADGSVSDNELLRVEREAGELVAAVQAVLVMLRQSNDAARRERGAR